MGSNLDSTESTTLIKKKEWNYKQKITETIKCIYLDVDVLNMELDLTMPVIVILK